MERKERRPEEQARRAKIRELLELSQVSSMEDIRNLFKETIAEFMEEGLDAELSEELGYSKYDYRNKETDNSRNGLSPSRFKGQQKGSKNRMKRRISRWHTFMQREMGSRNAQKHRELASQ